MSSPSLHHPPRRPLFPISFDSTILSSYRSCPHKAFRQYVEHWKPKGTSVHLVAGGAFAKGVEVTRLAFFESGESAEAALALGLTACMKAYGDFPCPAESPKSLARILGALEFYFSTYPLGKDGLTPLAFPSGRKAIEFSFALPLPDLLHPVTGDPILYTGRTDLIAEFCGGNYIVDEKTTSSLGQSWAKQWEMRGQFSGYAWAAEQLGIKTAGTIVRGVSILKTKYDTLSIPTSRSPFEISRWLDQTTRDIRRMISLWEEGYWDQSLDGGCTEYGGCSFVPVCKSPSPDSWLPVSHVKRVWDPLAREEVELEDWESRHQSALYISPDITAR
jgi:hypothetical protein